MRRKNDKEVRKEYFVLLILGIVSVLAGFFMLLQPLMPTTPYDEYIEKEVIISKFVHFSGGLRVPSHDCIITEDGEKYNITGEYNRAALAETLSQGTVVIIKYDVNTILPFQKYAEEMSVDGNYVVTYNNDKPIDWISPIIFCSIFCVIGVAFLFAYRSVIIRNKKLQAKRDARIMKKYGKPKK